MIVVDVNIVIYLLVEGEKTPLAQKLYRIDPQWKLPRLWRYEFLNFLSTLGRQKKLTYSTLKKLWEEALRLFENAEYDPAEELTLKIAYDYSVTAYDAQYLALASELKTYCITADKPLYRKVPALAQSIENFLQSKNN